MGIPCFFKMIMLILMMMKVRMIRGAANCGPVNANDRDRILFALNLEYFEAELFLNAALGQGLDVIAPNMSRGGPPPFGARRANLDILTRQIIQEFAFQEVGHLRAIMSRVGGIPRPLLNLSRENIAKIFDEAVGYRLNPPFDPYLNSVNFLLLSYMVPYVGLVGYTGTLPSLNAPNSRSLVASLLGVEAGQDAVLRTLLYQRANQLVFPYRITVGQFTEKLSNFKNKLAMCGNKDEGLIVNPEIGAENRTSSNILSADTDSLSYQRTPRQILRILYGSGNESRPGGFFPLGANGNIARSFLRF